MMLLLQGIDEMDPVAVAGSECGELDSPLALLSHQVELEALMEAGLELDFHSPEYAKFRMEQENDELVISPSKELYSLDSPSSDSDSIFDISGTFFITWRVLIFEVSDA